MHVMKNKKATRSEFQSLVGVHFEAFMQPSDPRRILERASVPKLVVASFSRWNDHIQ